MLRRTLSIALLTTVTTTLFVLPAAAQARHNRCFDTNAAVTVEETRLGKALPSGGPAVSDTLIRQGRLDKQVALFTAGLCALTPSTAHQRSAETARAFAKTSAATLWRSAVERAHSGDYDDRPLYWARVAMTKAIHQWRVDSSIRNEVFTAFDHAARGFDDINFPAGAKRIMVSGFDPFQLNGTGLRRSNPAGAAALQLDGAVFDTAQGKVAVQAVTLPVLWSAFDQGIVESAYGRQLASNTLDGIVTISQGSPGRFSIERWAANWRGGFPDNNDASERGAVPKASHWPQPTPQFIETTLPQQAMRASAQGKYPVEFRLTFCQWPSGQTPGTGSPDCHVDGTPTPGAIAASGGGGDYLSNESMYRANRLRHGLGLTRLHGGHLHTPVLDQPQDPGAISDAQLSADRKAIADETVSMIAAVATGA